MFANYRKSEDVVTPPERIQGERILKELERAEQHNVAGYADIVICDGGSSDGCTELAPPAKTSRQHASGQA